MSARPTVSVTLCIASMKVDRSRNADLNSEVDWSDTRSSINQSSEHTSSSEEQNPNGGP